ncbi:MAG: preprotein translocase subunit SecG [Planctomycetota bacterium]
MPLDSMITTLALGGIAGNLLTLGFLIICVVMILIVLIQRPQGGGLSGAFGSGAGSGQTAFGAKTGDALTYATIGIFVLFLIAAVGLNFAARPTVPAAQETALVGDEAEQAEETAAAGSDEASEAESGSETDADATTSDEAAPDQTPDQTPIQAPADAGTDPAVGETDGGD